MNVLLLSQFFSTTRGGGEYLFSLIAKNLAKKGHKVWVITNRIADENYQLPENVEIVFVKPVLQYAGGLPTSFLDNIRYTINATMAGLRVIKKEKIDVIHSNNFAPSLAGSILSSLTSIPHVIAIHDIFSLCGKNYWKKWGAQSNVSRINVMLAPLFEKVMVKFKHDCIHTVSEATRDDLVQFGERKPIHVIYNSIETESEPQKIGTDPLRFVHVGRLVFYKNLEVVIKAVSIVKKSKPQIKLVIAGDGPHRRSLEELVKSLGLESNVEFKGYVNADEKIKLIVSSNALVFPSLCEGFGLVILEAFMQKKPVLVSDIRPMSDIVVHRYTGFVLNPHNEKVWAEHLLELVQDAQLAIKMGQNGYHLLEQSYSQDNMINKILAMYASISKN